MINNDSTSEKVMEFFKKNPSFPPDKVISDKPIRFIYTRHPKEIYDGLSEFMQTYTDDVFGENYKYIYQDEDFYFTKDKNIIVVQVAWARATGAEDDREGADVYLVKNDNAEYRVYCQHFYQPKNYSITEMKNVTWCIFKIEINSNSNININEAKEIFEKIIHSLRSNVPQYSKYIRNINILYTTQYYFERPTQLLGE